MEELLGEGWLLEGGLLVGAGLVPSILFLYSLRLGQPKKSCGSPCKISRACLGLGGVQLA